MNTTTLDKSSAASRLAVLPSHAPASAHAVFGLLRRLVEETDGLYVARDEELPLLRYYAHSIAHLLQTP